MNHDGTAPAIDLSIAQLGYRPTVVFDGFALTFDGGRWTVLLGPSGVGKTTLLRVLAGLESGDGIRATADGRALAGRVALMAQQVHLLPWLSIAANAALGWRLRGAPVTHELAGRIEGLLEALGLAAAARRLPAGLSGGERQRAALARTLIEDRPVVLLDEPFAALDAVTRLRLQDVSRALLDGRTVIMVTHDPWEALRLADRIVVLNGRPARIVLDLTPHGAAPRGLADGTLAADYGRLIAALSGDEGVQQ